MYTNLILGTFVSNFDFDRGSADIIPTPTFAEAICKALAPEQFLEDRELFFTEYQPKIHQQHYKGHEGVGVGPSEIIQSLFEFANQNEVIGLHKGKIL